jgi:hypothetical protein
MLPGVRRFMEPVMNSTLSDLSLLQPLVLKQTDMAE